MSNKAALAAAEAVGRELSTSLGDSLAGFYLYGSVVAGQYHPDHSDVNLVAITTPEAPPHVVRDAFSPLWDEYADLLRQGPLLLPEEQLRRFGALFPALLHHWQNDALQLAGAGDPLENLPATTDPESNEELARDAREALRLSSLLAPQMVDLSQQVALQKRLHRLVWRLTQQEVPDTETPQLLARAHEVLGGRVAALASEGEAVTPAPSAPPPLLPDLLAIYERGDEAILVLPEPLAPFLEKTDWPAVAEAIAEGYFSLGVTTPAQLSLLVQQATPIEHCVGYYTHAWGNPLLDSPDYDTAWLLTVAARQPLWLRVARLPGVYLTAPDERLGALIHDFQNKLLNIQLQYELLGRIKGLDGRLPPALPDRTAPPSERIAAIFEQLDWWVDQLLSEAVPEDG